MDWSISRQFLENVEAVLNGRSLDYLVINHMEPDHAACIEEIILRYPEVKIISTQKSFVFMNQFGFDTDDRIEEVADGDTKSLENTNLNLLLHLWFTGQRLWESFI